MLPCRFVSAVAIFVVPLGMVTVKAPVASVPAEKTAMSLADQVVAVLVPNELVVQFAVVPVTRPVANYGMQRTRFARR